MRAVKHTYKCDVCGREYTSRSDEDARNQAKNCEESHEFVYLKLLKSDVQRLLAFIYSKEDQLLTESLIDTLKAYRKL